MVTLRLVPEVGEVFVDARGEGRTLRVSWHDGPGVVVVSLWSGGLCRGSFRLPAADLPRLRELLAGIDAARPGAALPGAAAGGAGAVDGGAAAGGELEAGVAVPAPAAEPLDVIDATESTGVIRDTSGPSVA